MTTVQRALVALICDETRHRPHGYQLRCHEPVDHDGEHRWTPELTHAHQERTERRDAR